jgi:hypothetical protein
MKKSALSVALSKPGDAPPADDKKKDVMSDTFSFPCLTPPGAETDSALDDEFENMKLSDSQLAGSISNAVLLPNGSLAVSPPPASLVSTSLKSILFVSSQFVR